MDNGNRQGIRMHSTSTERFKSVHIGVMNTICEDSRKVNIGKEKVRENGSKKEAGWEPCPELRTNLRLRRTEFGAKIGYTRQQIMRVEDGQTPVSDELCRRICQEYKVNEEWLSREEPDAGSGPEEDDRKRRSRLRQVYEESGLTQREFGRKTHTATSMLNDVISGRRQMMIRYAKKIEETLGVGMDWLLYGDEAAKAYPCSESMIGYLKKHPELRKQIWDAMEEDGDIEGNIMEPSD